MSTTHYVLTGHIAGQYYRAPITIVIVLIKIINIR